MDELEHLFRTFVGAIVHDAHMVAQLPLQEQENAICGMRAAHVDEGLALDLSPEHAFMLAQSAAKWTSKAVEIIRERTSLSARVLN